MSSTLSNITVGLSSATLDGLTNQGPTGTNGPTGPVGPNGPVGPVGPMGPAGAGGAIGYYGVFTDSTTQTINTTATAITYNTTENTNGVSIGTPTSRIVMANAGTYNVQFSAQLTTTTGTANNVTIYQRINGVTIPHSATEVSMGNSNNFLVAAWNFVNNYNVGDYCELMIVGTASNAQIVAVAASGSTPSVPSMIVTVTQCAYNGPTGPAGPVGPSPVVGGTTGAIAYFTSATTIGSSILSQSGTTITNSGNETITGTLTTTGNTSLTSGNITASSTPVSWAIPYWTSTGYNLSSYSYTSGQGSAFGTVGATQCGLFSTGLSLAANTTYQMTITNMVFNSATGTNPYFTIQGGSNILYTSANNLTTTSTTRTFYFSTTVALPGGIVLFFYDYLNGTTSPYFFFGTITVNAVSVQASSMAVAGNESVGGTLTVGGATTVGALQVNGNLNVTGSGTFGTSMIAFNANHYNWNVGRFAGGGYFTTSQYWKIATLYGSTSSSMGAMYVRGMLGGWVVNSNDQMEVDLYIMTRGSTAVCGTIRSTNYSNAVSYMDISYYVNGSGYTEVYLVTKGALPTYVSFDLDVGSSGIQGSLTTVQLWDPATTTALTSAPGTMTSLTALCQTIQSGTDLNLYGGTFNVSNSSTYQTAGVGIINTGGGTAKSAYLSVSGTSGWATQGTFGLYNGATASGEPNGFPLIVQATSGNVGIGVCGPSSQLHVKTTTSSSYTTPVVLIQNTQTNPKNCLTILGSGLTANNSAIVNIGQDLSVNNAMGLSYVHVAAASSNNRLSINPYGGSEGLTITVGGKVAVGTYNPATNYAGYYKQLITGGNGSASGAHIEYFTDTDNYPLFQQLNWSHDNVSQMFDMYYDGTFRNSSSSAGWIIYKTGGVLSFRCYAPSSAGNSSTFYESLQLSLGQATFPFRALFQGVYTSTAQPYCQIGGNGAGNLAVGAGGVVFGGSTMAAYQSVGMINTIGSGWDYVNGRFWITTDGRWLININFYFNSFSGGTRLQLQRVSSGGSIVETRYCCLNGAGFGSDTTYSYAGEMYCYYGDYLRVVVASGGGCTFYYGGMDHSHLTFTFLS